MSPLKSRLILDLLEILSTKHEIYWVEEDMSFLRELATSSGTTSKLSFIKLYYRQPGYDGTSIELTIVSKFANSKQDFVFYYSPTLQDELYAFLRGYSKDYI